MLGLDRDGGHRVLGVNQCEGIVHSRLSLCQPPGGAKERAQETQTASVGSGIAWAFSKMVRCSISVLLLGVSLFVHGVPPGSRYMNFTLLREELMT